MKQVGRKKPMEAVLLSHPSTDSYVGIRVPVIGVLSPIHHSPPEPPASHHATPCEAWRRAKQKLELPTMKEAFLKSH